MSVIPHDPYVKATIAFVNRVRAEQDLPPITDLCKGVRKSPFRCCVAKSLRVSVAQVDADTLASEKKVVFNGIPYRTTEFVQQFIHRFDNSEYEEYVEMP